MLYPLSYEGLKVFGPQLMSLSRTIRARLAPTRQSVGVEPDNVSRCIPSGTSTTCIVDIE
jgi:hypothetical protein